MLEAAKQSAEDRATAAQAAPAAATTERDSHATRLAQAEAGIEKLRAAVTTANDAIEKATTATATTEGAAREVAQKKTAL
jgi:chromosome segregation ATPase